MTIYQSQMRDVIIKPSLAAIGLYNSDAVELLMLTAATETQLGKFVKQINGPALGIYQMEPATYNDVWNRAVGQSVAMRAKIQLYCGYAGKPAAERLITDMALATIMCRLLYYLVPAKLPSGDDVNAMSQFYKMHFNTMKGKNTAEKAYLDYNQYCKL